MQIDTQRFGTLEFNTDHLFTFPQGLIGMETLRQWAMIPDADNPSVAWLQSASRGDRAIAVISPKAFCPDYRVRTTKRALASLQLRGNSELYVLTVVSGHVGKLTTNLRAPLMLNLHRRIGCQIITNDDQELRRSLPSAPAVDHSRRDGRIRADQAVAAASPAPRPAVAPRRAA